MIYEDHLLAAELGGWQVESGVAWDRIDGALAASQPEILAALRDATLIEGYLPVFIPRLMGLLWDDVDATAVLSVELYDGLKHYTVLKRYLDRVGFERAELAEEALVAARRRARLLPRSEEDVVAHLTNFMCSELFAAYFFLRLARQSREPVLKELLTYLARDEFRHAAGAGDLLRKRIAADPSLTARILNAAERFRHYGNDVVEVPVAERNDFEAILAVNRRVRQLCGVAPTEHLKEAMRDGDQ